MVAVPANSVLIYTGRQRTVAAQFGVLSVLSFAGCIVGASVDGARGAAMTSSGVFVISAVSAFVLAHRVANVAIAPLRRTRHNVP